MPCRSDLVRLAASVNAPRPPFPVPTFVHRRRISLVRALPLARKIATLEREAAQMQIPTFTSMTISANGSRISNKRSSIATPLTRAAESSRALQPEVSNYFVLKPKHSGFYAKTLDLLEYLKPIRWFSRALRPISACCSPRTTPTCALTDCSCLQLAWPRKSRNSSVDPTSSIRTNLLAGADARDVSIR
jgi:hypothetical protein